MWIAALCGILTASSWGVGEFWTTRVVKGFGPMTALASVNILIAGAFAAYYGITVWATHANVPFHIHGYILAATAGGLLAVGEVGVYKAYEIGPISLVSPLASIYPLASTLLAMVAFRAHLSGQQLTGIVVILAGVMVASGLLSRNGTQGSRRGPYMAIGGAVTWGVAFAFLAQASLELGWQLATFLELLALAYVSVHLASVVTRSKPITGRAYVRALQSKYTIGAASLQLVGYATVALGGAASATDGAVVAAISACYPAITVVMARLHYREQTSLTPLLGAFAGMAGVVMLTLG